VRGGVIAVRTLDRERWIQRRVESVEFLGDTTVRRRVSVDFEPPDRSNWKFKPEGVVPLALLEKTLLVDFDSRDESDTVVPILTSEQNGFLSWSALVSLADSALRRKGGGDLSEPTIQILRTIATGTPEEAENALFEILEASLQDKDSATMVDNPLFDQLSSELAGNFLLLIDFGERPEHRRVIKFSYVEELEDPTLIRGILSVLGLRRAVVLFDVPAVGECRSYHFECQVPDDLEISEAALLVEADDDFRTGRSVIRGSMAHMHFNESVPPEAQGTAFVFLNRRTSGFVRLAWISSLLTAGALTVFNINVLDQSELPSSSNSILLAIPGILSAIATRPGEHRLATRLFFGARVEVGISGLLAYSAAISLTLEIDAVTRDALWAAIVAAAWGTAALLTLGMVGIDRALDRAWAVIYDVGGWIQSKLRRAEGE
jgi:hypothetical protein